MQERPDLPPREDALVLAGVTAVTMDAQQGTLSGVDLLVRDGELSAVGPDLRRPPQARVVDGRGLVVVPGFVDTHWHLWNSLFRGVVADAPGRDYFAVKRRLGPALTVDDFYWSARFALAEALLAGITTVHNWDHNVRSAEDADLNVRAQLDAGVRGRFSYGPRDSPPGDVPMDLEDLRRFAARWGREEDGAGIDVGVALRGPYRTEPEVTGREWSAARSLGLPITMHCDRCLREPACTECGLTRLGDDGLLGPDVQIVHAVHATTADVEALARSGSRVSLSPITEMRTMGFPRLTELLEAGVPVSLSTDTLAMPAAPDVLATLRAVEAVEIARCGSGRAPTPLRLLELATIDGARDLGIADVTGSITSGKRADLVVLDATAPHLRPSGDVVEALVRQARGSDVVMVVADGRVLVERGSLTQPSAQRALDTAEARRDAIIARAAAVTSGSGGAA